MSATADCKIQPGCFLAAKATNSGFARRQHQKIAQPVHQLAHITTSRRTFIANAARTISMVGGSLRDVQMLAGHCALSTTQRYIEADVEAQKRVVDLV
jgi:site-specific recombinase XerD